MSFHSPKNKRKQVSSAPLARVRAFLSEHGAALVNACEVLGGQPAHQRCLRLLADMHEATDLTRHLCTELVALHRLLMLDRVHDPESTEAACFALIDPTDPIVHDLCLLADRLHDLLVAIAGDVESSAAAALGLPQQEAA